MKKLFIYISVFTASITMACAQIPNAGFETWDNSAGYNTPTGWDNMNAMTSSMSVYTCVKGTPGYSGGAYLKLTTKSVSGMGTMPGVAMAGVMDMSNMTSPQPMSGFPFTQRPQNLTGAWQYMAYNGDQGYVAVILTKWNSAMNMRDTIATLTHPLAGMVMSWSTFSLPLTYQSTNFPDSAMIVLSASGASPSVNSYLYVDTLAFTGSVAGTTGINDPAMSDASVVLYPNPAHSYVSVKASEANALNSVELIDLTGRVVGVFESSDHSEFVINTASFAKGAYFVKYTGHGITGTKKLVIE